MRTTFCELCEKEVINICNGKRIGHVEDLEIDLKDGCITSIIVPGPSRCWGFVKSERDFCIPWDRICKIGSDVILVEYEFKSSSE